jgi:hypothetical protein
MQWFIGDQGMQIGAPQTAVQCCHTWQVIPQYLNYHLISRDKPFQVQWGVNQGTSPFKFEVSISRDKPFQVQRGVNQGTSPFNYSMEALTDRGQCGHPAHCLSRDSDLPEILWRYSPTSPTQEHQQNGQPTIRGHSLDINIETNICLLLPINQRRSLHKKSQTSENFTRRSPNSTEAKSHSCLHVQHQKLQTACQQANNNPEHTN